MIEVKGTRSAQPAIDPSDPLGLRKPPDAGTGVISGMVVGLLGLAMYLRSFLWTEPVQVQMAPEPDARAPAEDDTSAPPVARAAPKATAVEQPKREEPPASEAAAADTQTSPIFFGPIDLGVIALIAPAAVPSFAREFAANTPLPPFNRPGRVPVPEAAQMPIPLQGPGQSDAGSVFESDDPGPMPDDQTEDDLSVPDTNSAPRNRAPRSSGPVYLGDVGSGATLAIALSHLLVRTSDADGDALSVAMIDATSGSVQPHKAGWRYLADTDHLGEVEVSYQVSDGQHIIQQTAVLNVIENLRIGTGDADLILGTEGRDRVLAHDGDDNVATFSGRDVVFGGKGDDNIAGGAGRDSLFGDDGDDLIAGGADADLIFGGGGHDRLYGEAGDDEIHGDAGNDLVDGGEGADTLTGDAGDDSLLGGEGDDLLSGGEGDDLAEGGSGVDVIFGDAGDDHLLGEAGADLLFGGEGQDTLDGGADNDVLSGNAGRDLLLAGSGDDVVAGGDGDDRIEGGDGADHLTGEAGADLLFGGEGQDTLDGGADNDVLSGNAGHDLLLAGSGDDVAAGGDGDDRIEGGDGADQLAGGDGRDTIAAGEGDDVVMIDIDMAADLLDGGEGFDQLVAAPESSGVLFDLIEGAVSGDEGPADTVSGFEAYVGSAEDDVFKIAEGEATLTGNDGADLFAFVQGDRLEAPQSSYSITDFSDADMMTFSNEYAGLSMRKAQRSVEERVEEFFDDFAERFNADEPRLRYFHDWLDDYQRTIVEVDFDHDRSADLIVSLEGGHEFDISPYSH